MAATAEVRYTEPYSGNPEKFVEGAVDFIRKNVGSEKVLSMCSGGVDSTTVTALLDLAGCEMFPRHLDTGFMRIIRGREEPDIVKKRFGMDYDNFEVVEERKLFQNKVFGIEDPNDKRRGFKEAYQIAVDRLASNLDCGVMAQGTIKGDIEITVSGQQSQHNVGNRFRNIGSYVAPLAGCYKNDVRQIGWYLYKEHEYKSLRTVKKKQPFPGPGLSVRTVGLITKEKLAYEKWINDITEQSFDEYSIKKQGTRMKIREDGTQIPFQSYGAILDAKFQKVPEEIRNECMNQAKRAGCEKISLTVTKNIVLGIKKGKERAYRPALCIENHGPMEYSACRKIADIVPTLYDGISRVFYKVADGVSDGKYVAVLRSVVSKDAKEASVYQVPFDVLRSIGYRITKGVPSIQKVCVDITGRPPGTIEME